MTMLKDALAIAERGWPVFPCDPKTKQPYPKADRDPQTREPIPNTGGVKKASRDPVTIRAWWSHWPKAMIGIPTGSGIGAFVIDIDAGEDKKTGEVFEAAELQIALEKEIGEALPPTLFGRTPRGGVHLYFALPADSTPGNRAGIIKRIDVRGEGGYVIAPPSVRDDGKAYTWGSSHTTPLASAPPALLDLIFRRGRWADRAFEDDRPISARAAAAVKPPSAGIGQIDDAVRKYGLSALDGELRHVRETQQGGRNDALNNAALKLGQLVSAGVLNESLVRAALEDAAAACGLIRDDGIRSVRATIESGMRKGKSQPRDLAEVRQAAATRAQRRPPAAAARISSSPPLSSVSSSVSPAPPAAEADGKPSSQTGASAANPAEAGRGGAQKPPRPRESDEALNRRLAFFPLTDLGNAERFRERYKDKLKWCQALGWLAWDGKRWSRVNADSLVKIAEHDTVRAIQREAAEVRDSGIKGEDVGGLDYVFEIVKEEPVMFSDKLAKWGRSSEAVNKLGALSKRGEPYFAVGIEKLDADPMKINVNNGTIVVDRGNGQKLERDYITFRPHDPADLITKLAPVDYDPEATCAAYDAFLGRVQPDAAMRRFLHQWGGLSLTGDVSEQILAFFYGKGGNGKSVLVDAWSFVAGDYGETVPIETFIDHGKARNAGQATPDLAILPGVRMLRTSEPEKNSKLAEAMVKLATGGEPIQARHLNKDFFKFYPQFKLTMSGNYRPTIVGTDEGIWRRVRLVPFNVSIPKAERDRRLPDKLRGQASGILNRLLDGLRDWCDVGLTEPEEITKATAEYRDASDPLGRFLAACVEASPEGRVQSSELFKVFEAWCKSSGETAWKNRGFSMAMDERGYKRKHSDVVWWLDIKLIRSMNDFVDHEGNPIKIKPDGEKKNAGPVGDIEF